MVNERVREFDVRADPISTQWAFVPVGSILCDQAGAPVGMVEQRDPGESDPMQWAITIRATVTKSAMSPCRAIIPCHAKCGKMAGGKWSLGSAHYCDDCGDDLFG